MENFSNERPALGDLKVGDEVIVQFGQRPRRDMAATVVKVARVWIELKGLEGHSTWRMRRDTQDEGSKYSFDASFLTPEQYAWTERLRVASEYISKAGIRIEYGSAMYTPAARVCLAEMIRKEFGK